VRAGGMAARPRLGQHRGGRAPRGLEPAACLEMVIQL
jgi:hypothetical protein